MHSFRAKNMWYPSGEQRTAARPAVCWGILHDSPDFGLWPATIPFTSVAQRDNLPLSAIHRSPCQVISVRTEMRTGFADISYDCGFETQTHLHYCED